MALIDTGAKGDFISKEFIKRNRLRQLRKTKPYLLNTINKIPYRNKIIRKTEPLEIKIKGRNIIV